MTVQQLEEGLRHHQAGRFDQAEELYRQVLSHTPRQADALHLMGMAAHARGRFQQAHELVSRAVALKPSQAIFHANLGVVLESLERTAEAEAAYRHAMSLNPQHVSSLNNLGNVHRAQWRLAEAAECYQAALKYKPDFATAHSNLGNVLADNRRFDEAIACYRRALELDASFFDARKNLVNALGEQGRYREACQELAQMRALWPNNSGLKIWKALLLPVIPESVESIDERRRELDEDLDGLLQEDLLVNDPIAETPGPCFYLAYHGRNDVELQKKIARVYLRAVPSLTYIAPHCRNPQPTSARPIRIGVISRFFQKHSIGDHFAGLIRQFPRKGAHYTVFRFPGPTDKVSHEIEASADDVVMLSPRIVQAQQQVSARKLDLLFYTDIGMDPWTYFLAFSRLAPVQCATVGHPITTGIPNVDYFLSCDRLEAPEADEHYSERLIRLTHMPHFFTPPQTIGPAKTRADYPLPPDARWYICQQTLFKMHPEFDGLIGQILHRDPRGIVILFEGQLPQWQHLVLERMRRTIPGVVERIRFLPRLPLNDYLGLLPLADALIDTIHFSAGTTALQATALGLPMVTLPSRLNRGRGIDAVYRKLDISDSVAKDADEYVRMALRIANDRAYRTALGARILERSHLLFRNPSVGVEMEEFFIDAVRRRESENP